MIWGAEAVVVAVGVVNEWGSAGGGNVGREVNRRGPEGIVAAENGGKSRAAIIEVAGGERRETE